MSETYAGLVVAEYAVPLMGLVLVAIAGLIGMTIFVAVKSAATIAREREKQSLNDLRTITLERGELLAGKLKTLQLPVVVFLMVFALLMLLTLVASYHLSWLGTITATAMSWGTLLLEKGLGCWCSVVCRTSLRAMTTTLVVLAALMVLPMLLRLPLEAAVQACGSGSAHDVRMFEVSFSAIVGNRCSLFSIPGSGDNRNAETIVQDEAALLGATTAASVYALAGILLYRRACRLSEEDVWFSVFGFQCFADSR